MEKSTPKGSAQAGVSRPAICFGTAFERHDTRFLRAVAALNDLLEHPPSGRNSFQLTFDGIDEVGGLILRALPLRTAQEAVAAQAISLRQVLDDGSSLRLGEAVIAFIEGLQAEAERIGLAAGCDIGADGDARLLALEAGAAGDPWGAARAIADAEAQTMRGVLVKLRLLRRALDGGTDAAWADAALLGRLAASATDALERLQLAEDARHFDEAVQAFAAEAPPVLPTTPTDSMIAAGAHAGKVAVDAARRIYDAMAAAFLTPSKDPKK